MAEENKPAETPKPDEKKPDQGTLPLGDDVKARLAAIEAENAKLKKAADDADKKAKDAAAKAAAKKAAEEGTLTETLAQAQAALAKAEAERERLVAATTARIDKLVAQLPEADKALVTKFKDKMSFADWSEFVEETSGKAAVTVTGDKKPIPPHIGGVTKDRGSAGEYEPTDRAREILDGLMRSDAVLRTVRVGKDPSSDSAWNFYKPIKNFIEDMPRKVIRSLSHEEAMKRKLRPEK